MTKTIKPLILSVAGTALSDQEIELFKQYEAVGFILFARNIETRNQTIALTTALKALYPDRKVPIFIDQEGGRVARVKPPIAKKLYPAAEHFSTLYDENKNEAKHELKNNYIELMSELKDLGIDSPCAPVCDLHYKHADAIIGDRSFGNNPEKVIDLCKEVISGIHHAAGLPFIKHIPGHGRAKVDSHFELPIIDEPLASLENTDFKVFKELADEKAWAMTAHIIYSAIDPKLPATISPDVVSYIRNNIGFAGKLISDDICMYALHGEIGEKHAVLKRVINMAKKEQNWKENYTERLQNLFNIDAHDIGNSIIIEMCENKLLEIKPEFLESLAKITRMTLRAGCDIILHCSGDIKEMRTICDAL